MSKALFAYDAWNTVTFTGEEIKNPSRNLPLSLVLGTAIVTILYTTATMAYMYVIPIDRMANVADNRIAAEAAKVIFGAGGLYFISAAILISTFGCNNGLILGGPRVYYAMAKDGLFFKGASAIHPRYGSPINSLIYQAIWASILTLTGTYSDLLSYIAFASVLFNALTVIGVYILRRRQPALPRPYRTLGYPVVPALYVLIAILFLAYLVIGDFWEGLGPLLREHAFLEGPGAQLGHLAANHHVETLVRLILTNSGRGMLLILIGFLVYFEWKKRQNKDIPLLLCICFPLLVLYFFWKDRQKPAKSDRGSKG
jgi:APA family basic amino acid/polyamine antiporter